VEDFLILVDPLSDRIEFVFAWIIRILRDWVRSEFHHRCHQEQSGFRRRQVPTLDQRVAGAFFGKAAAARSTDKSIIDSDCCGYFSAHVTDLGVSRRLPNSLIWYGGKDSQQSL